MTRHLRPVGPDERAVRATSAIADKEPVSPMGDTTRRTVHPAHVHAALDVLGLDRDHVTAITFRADHLWVYTTQPGSSGGTPISNNGTTYCERLNITTEGDL